jgi:hypothetical protein
LGIASKNITPKSIDTFKKMKKLRDLTITVSNHYRTEGIVEEDDAPERLRPGISGPQIIVAA